MLPKNRRISRKEFVGILGGGKRYNSLYLLLYIYKLENNTKESKFSFSLSKKIFKTAVLRNKYRRRGYSIIKRNIKLIKPGFNCLFVFKKGSNKVKFESLQEEIIQLLSTSSVLI